jgi:AcrR family transcriptional regulator
MARVKKAREYDSSGRREQSRKTREKLIEIAREEFLERGYAATTLASVAEKAGVSVETVYKGFGGKAGLARAIYERGLAGRGPTSAPRRSDEIQELETDPRNIIRSWGAFVAEVSPLVSPILLLVRTAAATDPELVSLLEESDRERLARMRHNARRFARRGFLRDGVTVNRAADVMWTYTAPELYDLLVNRRGWSPKQFGEFVASAMIAALLAPCAQEVS